MTITKHNVCNRSRGTIFLLIRESSLPLSTSTPSIPFRNRKKSQITDLFNTHKRSVAFCCKVNRFLNPQSSVIITIAIRFIQLEKKILIATLRPASDLTNRPSHRTLSPNPQTPSDPAYWHSVWCWLVMLRNPGFELAECHPSTYATMPHRVISVVPSRHL